MRAATEKIDLDSGLAAWAEALRTELDATEPPSLNGSPSDMESRYAYRRMGEAGLIGVHWPEELGGRGATIEQSIALEETLGYYWLPMCGFLLSVKTIGNALLRFGSGAQQRTLLPAIAAGQALFCQGFSEPDAGSDLASLRTRAARTDDGWSITGRKIWTSRASEADWIYLAARTDPTAAKHRGISVFVLPMDTPGITPTSHDTIGGGSLGEVELVDAFAPQSSLVGELNGGWPVLMGTMDFERVTSEKVDVSSWLLDALEPHATPAQRRELLETRGQLAAARLIGLDTARMLEQGLPASASASMCKLSIALIMQRIAQQALEVLGPDGLIEATSAGPHRIPHGRVAAFVRASVATTIAGGASDIQRAVIARRGLGLGAGPTQRVVRGD